MKRRVLVVDVGGEHVKLLATGKRKRRKFVSGPTLTPQKMVSGVLEAAAEWRFDAVTIGYPGPVRSGRPAAEPHNLARGWVRFDFRAKFGRPVRIINDAAMQALGSYRHGRMLFLGLGTGLGSAMVVNGEVVPLELAHLPYRRATYEDYVGERGLKRLGRRKWLRHVTEVVALLRAALQPEDVVIGGGNVRKIARLPRGVRRGDNSNAFRGGFRLWQAPRGGA